MNCKIVDTCTLDRVDRSFLITHITADGASTLFYHRIDKGFLVSMATLLQQHIQLAERNQIRQSRAIRRAQDDEFTRDDSKLKEHEAATVAVKSRIEEARDKFEFVKNLWIAEGRPDESCIDTMEMPQKWLAEMLETWDD